MDTELKSALIDARAKIMWGTPLPEIRESLTSQGLNDQQINTVLQTCLRERDLEIRKIGIRDTAIGAGIIAIAGAILVLGWFINRFFIYAPVIAVFGMWRLFKGIERLIGGARTKGSITEM
jgi:hypothetical protein